MSDSVVVMRGIRSWQKSIGSKHFNQEDIMKAAWGGTLYDEYKEKGRQWRIPWYIARAGGACRLLAIASPNFLTVR